MTIVNDSPVRGSRISKVIFSRTAVVQNQTPTGVALIGQNGVGMPMRGAGKFLGMYVSCSWAGGAASQSVTVTALKNGTAAGNRFFSTQIAVVAPGSNGVDNTTPAIAANCEFADGDQLFLVIVTSATSGTIDNVFVSLDFEAAR